MRLYLTLGQRAHIQQLATLGCPLHWHGFDADGLPVISRHDVRGWRTYALHPDGRGVEYEGRVDMRDDDTLLAYHAEHMEYWLLAMSRSDAPRL